eukprot:Blabericola_migrator_1__7211@NODE_365_length_9399_cov_81_035255_g292_i0_p7_GENE_NODE_365_length_9399_cov_81_035255_g292_i0NODE_365_length_9399_cov_81_035255_g292_i0_p7_ORF_typecomplete_len178_score17_22_NODE_365_length_9399_cov_81_035255_g292_i065217054
MPSPPRRASIASSRELKRPRPCAPPPPNVGFKTFSGLTLPPGASTLPPPRRPCHSPSSEWHSETRAKLEKVLSRGPSCRLMPTLIAPATTYDDDDEESVPNENVNLHRRTASTSSTFVRSSSVGDCKAGCLKRRVSGFMFDPDANDEKKRSVATTYAEGVKELRLRNSSFQRLQARS